MTHLGIGTANVTITLTDPDGTEHVRHEGNAFCDTYGVVIAKHAAGVPGLTTLPLTHVSLGRTGTTIHACDSVSGWSGTPVLDTASFVEGTGALTRTVATTAPAVMTSGALTLDLTGAGVADYIEWWVKVNSRAYLDLTTEALRLTTTAGSAYYAVTWAEVETALGAALVDGTWTRVTIAKGAFTATGVPSWASIVAVTLTLTANATASLTASWDDIALRPASYAVTAATTAVATEAVKIPVGSVIDNADGTVTATGYFATLAAVGTYRQLGIYANGGATLAGIVALDPPVSKTAWQSMTVAWTVGLRGA